MELQQLLGFLAAAQSESFSVAAKRTFRTQPAISLQIKALEDELKTRLFDRISSKRVMLTREGKLLRDLVAPILSELQGLTSRFNEACGRTAGLSVRIATHGSIMTQLLPEVLRRFHIDLPNVEISIIHRSREEILELLKAGDVDIGITSGGQVPTWAKYEALSRYSRFLISPPRHLLRKAQKLSLADLASHPLILPPRGSNTRAAVENAFSAAGLSYKLALEVTGKEAVKTYVRMGLGVSVVTEYYLSSKERRSFGAIDVGYLFGTTERGLITRRSGHLNCAAEGFCRTLRAVVGSK